MSMKFTLKPIAPNPAPVTLGGRPCYCTNGALTAGDVQPGPMIVTLQPHKTQKGPTTGVTGDEAKTKKCRG